MNKKKGFTLIELLAVIIIITIIALITMPVVFNAIDGARAGAIRSSAYGYINAIDFYAAASYHDDVTSNDVNWNAPFNWNTNKDNIDSKGRKPSDVDVTLENGKVDDGTMVFDDYLVTIENGKVISTEKQDGSVATGPFVYEDRAITYEWEDATTKIVFSDTDESYTALNLPFNINVNSDTFSTIYVQTNGIISLSDFDMGYSNTHITSFTYPAFSVMWMDLDVEPTGTSGVFYKYGNEDSKDYVLIEYRDVVTYSDVTTNSFEAKIYSDGTVKMSYKKTDGLNEGLFATSGIFISETNYDPYSHMQNILTNNLTIVYELTGTDLEPIPTIASTCFDFDWTSGTIVTYYSFDNYWNYPLPQEAYSTCTSDVIIPSEISGVPVTNIGVSAFESQNITSVVIPNSVVAIHEDAFSWNDLTTVVIPNSVKYLGDSAFESNDLTSVTLSNSLKVIGDSAFNGSYLTSLIIPEGVTTIKPYAFAWNELSNLTLPSTLTTIGNNAFNNNYLPDNQAFIYERNSNGTINYSRIADYGGINNNVVIPNGVTTIGSWAFYSSGILSVTFPNTVTTLEEGAFNRGLFTSITLPSSLTTIGDNAFQNSQLTNITIPSSVNYIGVWAFYGSKLTSVTISNGLAVMGHGAFSNNLITSITFGAGVTTIYDDAFAQNKLTSLVLPNTVTTINQYAFMGNLLTSIDFGTGITEIGYWSISNNKIPQGSAIIRRADGTVNVDGYAFYNNGTNGTTHITPTYIP